MIEPLYILNCFCRRSSGCVLWSAETTCRVASHNVINIVQYPSTASPSYQINFPKNPKIIFPILSSKRAIPEVESSF
jgi:hypothetical protein